MNNWILDAEQGNSMFRFYSYLYIFVNHSLILGLIHSIEKFISRKSLYFISLTVKVLDALRQYLLNFQKYSNLENI